MLTFKTVAIRCSLFLAGFPFKNHYSRFTGAPFTHSADPQYPPLRWIRAKEPEHGESLKRFLARLPGLWQKGEARPTRKERVRPPRRWRTRKDPFEGVWCDVLLWLDRDPDTTVKDLLARLSASHPERFSDAQLRTLQRRMKGWRGLMAKKLVYAVPDEPVVAEQFREEPSLVSAGIRG